MPTIEDMKTSLEDARFFCDRIEDSVRGPQKGQDLLAARRYFRAYLHCWKCVVDYVKKAKGLDGDKNAGLWKKWYKKWRMNLPSWDSEIYDLLRKMRDSDTHDGVIKVDQTVAAGLFPIVMLKPQRISPPPPDRELLPCCKRGLQIAAQLINDHPNVPV